MRKTTILSWMGAAAAVAAFTFQASAQSVETNPTFTPAEGEVTAAEMQPIKVQLGVDLWIANGSRASLETNTRLVRLTDNTEIPLITFTAYQSFGGKVTKEGGTEIDVPSAKNLIALDFGKLEPGDYALMIGENALMVGKGNFANFNNAAINANWTVVESGAVNPYLTYTLAPSDGASVPSLKTFTVTYTEALGEQLIANPEITLTDGTNTLTAASVEKTVAGNGFTATFADEITASGDYTLSIPEGIFGDASGDFTTTAITASYKIEENPFNKYTFDPADGSTIAYEKYIDIIVNFTETGGDELASRGDHSWSEITLSNGTETYRAYNGSPLDNFKGFKAMFNLPETMSVGTYTFTVPSGFYTSDNGVKTPEITGTFTFTEQAPNPLATYSFIPNPDESVATLSEVKVLFPSVLPDEEITVEEGWLEYITLYREEPEDEIPAISYTQEATEGGKVVTFTFEKAATNGTYYFGIPARALNLGDFTNEENIMATYTVDPTSVEAIGIENGTADVYDMTGRTVLRAADADALRTLDGGLYIINGKKVIVRK